MKTLVNEQHMNTLLCTKPCCRDPHRHFHDHLPILLCCSSSNIRNKIARTFSKWLLNLRFLFYQDAHCQFEPTIIPMLLRNLQRGKYLSFLRLPGPRGDCLQPGTARHPCPRRCLLLVWPQVKANQFGFEGRNVKQASPGRSRCSAALS